MLVIEPLSLTQRKDNVIPSAAGLSAAGDTAAEASEAEVVRVADGADFGLVAKALKMEELSFLRAGGLEVVGFLVVVVVESDFTLEVRLRAGLVVVVVGSGVGASAGAGLGAVALGAAAAAAGFESAGGGGGRAPVRRWSVVRMALSSVAAQKTGHTFASGLYIVPYVFHVCSRSSLAYSVVILRLQSDRIWMF